MDNFYTVTNTQDFGTFVAVKMTSNNRKILQSMNLESVL